MERRLLAVGDLDAVALQALPECVASLMAEGLVTLDRVAQDGLKVRASAGAASFRREPPLEELLAEAEAQVAQLKRELESDPAAGQTRQQAARQRAIDTVSAPHGTTTVYASVMKSKDPNRDPHTSCKNDRPAVAQWRQRMATDEAKTIYKQRASTAECVHAPARNRGPQPRPATVPDPWPAESQSHGAVVRPGPQPDANGRPARL